MSDFLMINGSIAKRVADRVSTALEYFDAKPGAKNRATDQIDAGNEPYLLNVYAQNIGLHPYVEVHDVGSALVDGKVELFTANRSYLVDPETALVWK